jgi:hypothetical protein
MGAIYAALRDYFASTGLDVEEHPEAGWVATEGFGEHGSWLLVGQAHEDVGAAVVYSVLPRPVPEQRRTAIALLLARINYGRVIGNFELDLDDGEVRYKASLVAAGRALGRDQLAPLVATALGQVDRWLPALDAVTRGEDPAAAFAQTVAAQPTSGEQTFGSRPGGTTIT